MAVKIPPKLIIALVIVVVMFIFIFSFFTQILFAGPELDAASTVAEQINDACAEDSGFTTTFNVYLPDSKGVTPPDVDFFFISVEKHNLMLMARRWGVEKNDYGAQFMDFASCVCTEAVKYLSEVLSCDCKPGVRVIKTYPLENCKKKNIDVCWLADSTPRCDKFQFESNEGKESLTFTISRASLNGEKVILGYKRDVVCGDGRCCKPETKENCPADCELTDKCEILTV